MEQVLNFAYVDEDIDIIYNLYQNVGYGFSAFKPGISQLWGMVKIIHRSGSISQEVKTTLFDALYAKDETDTKIKYKILIDAMVSTGAERLAIYETVTSESLTLSADHLTYTLEGLNDSWVPEAERRVLADKYADQIFDLVKNRSMSIAKAFLGSFNPKIDDLASFEVKLAAAIGNLEAMDKFASKKMTQLLEFIKSINGARAL